MSWHSGLGASRNASDPGDHVHALVLICREGLPAFDLVRDPESPLCVREIAWRSGRCWFACVPGLGLTRACRASTPTAVSQQGAVAFIFFWLEFWGCGYSTRRSALSPDSSATNAMYTHLEGSDWGGIRWAWDHGAKRNQGRRRLAHEQSIRRCGCITYVRT